MDLGRVDHPNKTLAWKDLAEPAVAATARQLRRFLWRKFTLHGRPVAVNGVLRRRAYLRRLKMWEYARGLTLVPPISGQRVLDFGGGGTLPPFFAAAHGAEVHVIDLQRSFLDYGDKLARRMNWCIHSSSVDLAREDGQLPAHWPSFDAVHSYCVIEHIAAPDQARCLRKLARAVAPNGRLVLTFEYGQGAPGESPWRTLERLESMRAVLYEQGLEAMPPTPFYDDGRRRPLDRRHPHSPFTFGMIAFQNRP